jgi:hypothetical protein
LETKGKGSIIMQLKPHGFQNGNSELGCGYLD